jgi:energy-coupling factor transporter ATP-binding protein EcfA2
VALLGVTCEGKPAFGEYVLQKQSHLLPEKEVDEQVNYTKIFMKRGLCDIYAIDTCLQEDCLKATVRVRHSDQTTPLKSGDVRVLQRRVIDYITAPLLDMLHNLNPETNLIYRLVSGPRVLSQPLAEAFDANIEVEKVKVATDSQRAAVIHACSEEALTLLWGPPGTGKTTTVASVIRVWKNIDPELRVAVTATTNAALDVVLNRLQDSGLTLIRVVSSKYSGDDRRTFQNVVELAPEKLKHLERNAVIVGTVWQLRKVKIVLDALVVDEASQMPVAVCLLAAERLSPEGRVLVAGDLLQLPPILPEVSDSVDEPQLHLRGSVMQALMLRKDGQRLHRVVDISMQQPWLNMVQLRENHRSVPAVVDVFAELYPCGLISTRTPTAGVQHPLTTAILPENVSEATFIASRVVKELRAGADSVAVVTPHRKQRADVLAALRAHLDNGDYERVKSCVDTVERLQGGEAQVIIVAFAAVRYDSSFPFNIHRLNVALSRAKEKVIVVIRSTYFDGALDDALVGAEAKRGFALIQKFVQRSYVESSAE